MVTEANLSTLMVLAVTDLGVSPDAMQSVQFNPLMLFDVDPVGGTSDNFS